MNLGPSETVKCATPQCELVQPHRDGTETRPEETNKGASVVVDLNPTERDWKLVIDGALVSAAEQSDVINPATGRVITKLPMASDADVDLAVASATQAANDWRHTDAIDRGQLVARLADKIDEHGEELAVLDTMDNGSPLSMMRNDVRIATQQLRYFAGLTLELRGQSIPAAGGVDFTVLEPFGVVGRIIAFNHPLMFAATKLAAPLVAGNTVVLKPSEHTSLSALRIGELCAEVFPPGVVNVVTGLGSTVGRRLSEHPDVPRLAFIGSVATGLQIQRQAAANSVKAVTLELGGKNPLIVFGDADLQGAIKGAVDGMNFTWQGQSCGSTSRAYVHRSLLQPFLEGVAERVSALRVGDPFDENTDLGAVVNKAQFEKIARYIDLGVGDPAVELVAGGWHSDEAGFFVGPTVFSLPADSESPLLTEEIFGPVLSVVPFDDYDDVITRANALTYGLTGSVWTSSLDLAMRASRDLATGYVWVNATYRHIPGAPYGGVKNSGNGREENIDELYSYAQLKNIYIKMGEV
jgi:betaine-aldehyde dehydrogenase